jgi:serine protease Do
MPTRSATLRTTLALLLSLLASTLHAAGQTPAERLSLASRSTFEVVVPKKENDALKYERPLPLELLSFTERNDKYWSIGTAFAIDTNTFVSAGHVLLSAVGGAMGDPLLRDAAGKLYAVDKILRFSLHEDLVVFSVKNPPAAQSLTTNEQPALGAAVYAVGNALGEGIVIRDGLLTSQTPEEQDGRWKWLRFSAAASPGNSGGPLLDEEGRVIGVITAKSPNENLNYALPIVQVRNASIRQATIDTRESFGLPILRNQRVALFQEQFTLPATWEKFSTTLIDLRHAFYLKNQAALLKEQVGQIPPNGKSARLLATLDRAMDVALISQLDDDHWGLKAGANEQETELPDDGKLWISGVHNAMAFRLQRNPKSADATFYRNPTGLMDKLLLGLKLPRDIGAQSIRITSMGAPQRTQQHTDRFGRVWQEWAWSFGFSDLQLLVHALPTPEGYVGLMHYATASNSRSAEAELRLLGDYLHVYYGGSVRQWRALLAERELCPPLLSGAAIQHDAQKGLSMRLPAADVAVPRSVVALNDESQVMVFMGYSVRDRQLVAELRGFTALEKKDDSSFVGVWAQPKPADDAGTKLTERWDNMVNRRKEFTGESSHNAQFSEFWTRSVVGEAARGQLLEVYMGLHERALLPRQVSERRDQLLAGFKLRAGGGK